MNKELAEKAKRFINSHPELYLQKAKKTGYVCPLPNCQNGTHGNGTGIEPGGKDRLHFTCFRCNQYKHADVIDLIGMVKGVSDFPGKFRLACKEYEPHLRSIGISLEDLFPSAPVSNMNKKHVQQSCSQNMNKKHEQETCSTDMNIKHEQLSTHPAPATQQQSNQPVENPAGSIGLLAKEAPKPLKKDIDLSDLFDEWHANIDQTDYHRGLSKETLDRFNVGFSKAWVDPGAEPEPGKETYPFPALIIPTSKFTGLARDTRKGKRHHRQFPEGAPRRLFNTGALYKLKGPVFIVEGEIDALSIEDVGGSAVGLGGTSMISALVKLLKEHRPLQPLILSLDNDDPGQTTQTKLRKELDKLGIFYREIAVHLDCKDANEALMKDRAAFTKEVKEAAEITKLAQAEMMDSTHEELQLDTVSYALGGFMQRVEEQKDTVVRATGFTGLDRLLHGGLRAGLYVIGGVSALGKTTFCLQLLDQMARAGYDVMVFSLEMKKDQLIGKSLSRFTYLFARDKRHAVDVETLMDWNKRATLSRETLNIIDDAIFEYGTFGEKISIIEGDNSTHVSKVRRDIQKYVRGTGKAPIVLVDFLQILAYAENGNTDKQNVDRTVSELKRISRDFNIPLIAISSLNRSSYNEPVSFASFKESGGVEYSCDVLIGLQYEGIEPPWNREESQGERKRREERVKKAMQGIDMKDTDPIGVEIKVLKNRTGVKGKTALKFYPAFSCFSEVENPCIECSEHEDQDLDIL